MPRQVKISQIVIPKYLPLFNNRTIKHIILTSGRAGTKSSFAAIRADFQLIDDPDGSIVVLRKHHNKLRKTVYKEMLRGINRLGISKKAFKVTKSPMEITYRRHNTTMYFSGSDGIDDTKGIIDEDRPIKLVVLDELTEFFEDGEGEDELVNIEATFVRGNSAGFQMLYLYNPPKNPNAPINEWCRKMERRPDCLHLHTDYRDVPADWLGQDLISSAEAMKAADPKMYRWVWLGESVGVDELIYYMFGNRHIQKLPEDRIYQIGIIGGDYGQQNATTFQGFVLDPYHQKMRGAVEFYHSGRESGRQKTPGDYAQAMIDLASDMHEALDVSVFYLFLDPSARGLQEEIRRRVKDMPLPFTVRIRDAQNDVALGIGRVQKCLAFDVLTIAPAQQNAIREFGIYEYNKKSIERGKEEPEKVNDHCMDAIRYACCGAWRWLKQWLPSEAQADEWVNPLDREDDYDDF